MTFQKYPLVTIAQALARLRWPATSQRATRNGMIGSGLVTLEKVKVLQYGNGKQTT